MTALTVSVNGGPTLDAIGLMSGFLAEPNIKSSIVVAWFRGRRWQLYVIVYGDRRRRQSVCSKQFQFSLDSTRPTPPSSLDLAASDDTGISSTDNITRLNIFALSTTAEASSIVRFYRNGQFVEQSITELNAVLL